MSAAPITCDRCRAPIIPPPNRGTRCLACIASPAHVRRSRMGSAPAGFTPSASSTECTFCVPGNPLSVNRVHGIGFRGGKRVMYNTREGSQYKLSVQAHALQALSGLNPSWDRTRQYDLSLHCYFDNPRSDVDNPIKVVQDALQGVLWDNDVQVVATGSRKALDKSAPRLVITVRVVE